MSGLKDFPARYGNPIIAFLGFWGNVLSFHRHFNLFFISFLSKINKPNKLHKCKCMPFSKHASAIEWCYFSK